MGQGGCSVSWPVVPVLEAQLVSFLMRFSPPKPPSCRLIVAPSPCTELGPHLPFRGLQIYHSYCSLHISYRVPQISVLSIHLQSCIPRTTGVSQMAVLPNCFQILFIPLRILVVSCLYHLVLVTCAVSIQELSFRRGRVPGSGWVVGRISRLENKEFAIHHFCFYQLNNGQETQPNSFAGRQ